jgi:hypothetical protein
MRTHRRRSISDFAPSPLAAALALAFVPQAAQASSAIVNDPSDANIYDTTTPDITLRGAINHFNSLDVNGAPFCTGADSITFNTTDIRFSNGPFVVSPASQLPFISCNGLTIDGGGHQNDATSAVRVTGLGFPNGLYYGLISDVPGVVVKGLELDGFHNGILTSRALSAGTTGELTAIDNIISNSDYAIGGANASHNRITVSAGSTGIYVDYGGQIVTNNIIYSTDGTGIGVAVQLPPSPVTIAGNYVGIDDGTRPDISTSGLNVGISVNGATATVQGNYVTANNFGISLQNDHGSTVSTNNIGTDRTGAADGGGNNNGVAVSNSSSGTTIVNNVIAMSGNGQIQISHSSNITVNGNFLGTDRSVTNDLTGGWGVLAACSDTVAVTNNHIATNIFAGIEFDAVTNGGNVTVQGNTVGVKGDGVTPLGSSAYGLFLTSSTCGVGAALQLKRSSTKSGATAPIGATNGIQVFGNNFRNSRMDGILIADAYNTNIGGNTITGNGGFGINEQSSVVDPGDGNVWLQNTIYGNNGNKAVNLNAGALSLPNDPGDVDVSPVPNNGQNYTSTTTPPVVSHSGGNTTISFQLDSVAGNNYRLDFYANSGPTSVPGGDQYLGNTFLNLTSTPMPGSYTASGLYDSISIVVTKVDASGNGLESSEYSPAVSVITAPNVTLSTTSLNFGNVAIGSAGPPQGATISSTGTAPYQVFEIRDSTCYGGSICYGGPFTCTTTCAEGASYAPGQSCQVTATFNPTVTGSYSQTIALCDNVPPNQRNITLTGTGVVPPPVQFTPSAFDFGTVLLGATSAPEQFTLGNPGTSTVSIGAITATSGYVVNGTDCGTSLAPGTFCAVSVSFVPTGVGVISGTLSVAAAGGPPPILFSSKAARRPKVAGSTATASLTGTGAVEAMLGLPDSINLGSYLAGAAALSSPITLRASGNAFLTINSITVTGPFAMTNNCPANMAPGASCTITLTFSQNALGSYAGTLNVASNAVGGTRSVPLFAQTVAIAAPKLVLTPLTIGFGDRLFGSQSDSQRVTITNIGTAAATLSTTPSNADFLVSASNCGTTLVPSASCFADVVFRPAGFGPRQGSLVVNSNSADSPQSVTLAGSGCRPFSASRRGTSGISCTP